MKEQRNPPNKRKIRPNKRTPLTHVGRDAPGTPSAQNRIKVEFLNESVDILMRREFIETTIFAKRWKELSLTDDDLRELQRFIMENPDAGDIIQGTQGARKIRFAFPNRGKRGGVRIIYVEIIKSKHVHLLLCYAKANQEDLTIEQKQQVKLLVQLLRGE